MARLPKPPSKPKLRELTDTVAAAAGKTAASGKRELGIATGLRRAANDTRVGNRAADAALRIAAPATPPSPCKPATTVGRFGHLTLQRTERGFLAVVGDCEIPLSSTEVLLLKVLGSKPGKVQPRKQILDTVWGPGRGTPHALRMCIYGLRAKLKAYGATLLIRTRPGVGWALEPNDFVDTAQAGEIIAGDLIVNLGNQTARRGNHGLTLTPRQLEVLAMLMRNPGEVLTRHELAGQSQQELKSLRVVRRHIQHIRNELKAANSSLRISTEIGEGYKLVPNL